MAWSTAAKVVAKRDVHIPGLGACSKGSLLRADEPLVDAEPDAFEPYHQPRPRKAATIKQFVNAGFDPGAVIDVVEAAEKLAAKPKKRAAKAKVEPEAKKAT